MITIARIRNQTPTVCKWCQRLPMEHQPTFLVTIEGMQREHQAYAVCENCLREMKRQATKALKEE